MQKVFVGLSGGVDSAVSAALLKEAGYDVTGGFIKIWRPEFLECPWQKERLDAMRICAHLGIPFKEIDLSDEYKAEVIDDMIANYTAGRTPNPDVLCNRHIKFGAFKKWAHENGADLVATGHYAQVVKTKDRSELHRGKDMNKDQSYFLWRLTEKDLETTLFPVGGFTKPEVRVLAEKFRLPVATKKDSQGLCFVGEVTMRDFLARYVTLKKGVVVNERGGVIGGHDGAALYTLGERHGFRIENASASEAPHYIVAVDAERNVVTVSDDREQAKRDSVRLVDMSWVNDVPDRIEAEAQARHRETPVNIRFEDGVAHFEEKHLAPPGQSLVIYSGSRLIGGGVVDVS